MPARVKARLGNLPLNLRLSEGNLPMADLNNVF